MIMLRFGGLLIGRQAGGAAGWDQGQVTEHRTANGNPLFLLPSFATSTLCVCMCKTCPSYLSMLNCASNKTNSWKGLVSCESLTKVKFSTDQVRPALGSGSWLIVNHAQKPENGPISDLFNLTQNTFCLYCLILT